MAGRKGWGGGGFGETYVCDEIEERIRNCIDVSSIRYRPSEDLLIDLEVNESRSAFEVKFRTVFRHFSSQTLTPIKSVSPLINHLPTSSQKWTANPTPSRQSVSQSAESAAF